MHSMLYNTHTHARTYIVGQLFTCLSSCSPCFKRETWDNSRSFFAGRMPK